MNKTFRLCWFKAAATLQSQAERNYLHYLWWVLEPLILVTVFYLVFGVLL